MKGRVLLQLNYSVLLQTNVHGITECTRQQYLQETHNKVQNPWPSIFRALYIISMQIDCRQAQFIWYEALYNNHMHSIFLYLQGPPTFSVQSIVVSDTGILILHYISSLPPAEMLKPAWHYVLHTIHNLLFVTLIWFMFHNGWCFIF